MSKKVKRNFIITALISFLLVGTGAATKSLKPIDIVNDLPKGNGSYAKRPLDQIDTIVVHHAAVPSDAPGATPYGYAQFHITPQYINGQQYYGWPGIAYHVVIMPNGEVFLTNYLETISYHVGTMNPRSVGILVSGNFDEEAFTPLQEKRLIQSIKWVQKKVGKKLNLKGHYEYSSKTCPGYFVRIKLDEIAKKTNSIR